MTSGNPTTLEGRDRTLALSFLGTAIFMGLVGGGLAAVIRTQLSAETGAELVSPELYQSIVTMHGTLMVFFCVTLGLFQGLGQLLLPAVLGVRQLARPRLGFAALVLVVIAGCLLLVSFLVQGGAAGAGWTSRPPLSALPDAFGGSGLGQDLWLLSIGLFSLSFLATALRLLSSLRGAGSAALAVCSYRISASLGLVTYSGLLVAVVLLALDRHAGTSFFLPADVVLNDVVLAHAGGLPHLFRNLFWYPGHPQLVVVLLPALGLAFEVVAVHAQRPPYARRLTLAAMWLMALGSLLVWIQRVWAATGDPYPSGGFPVIVSVTLGVLTWNLASGLWRGRVSLCVPMLFAIGVMLIALVGVAGGLWLGIEHMSGQLTESYFELGHLHVMVGALTLSAMFAAIYHWFPSVFGRALDESLGRWHFLGTCVPLLVIFALMQWQGLHGLLRHHWDHSAYDFAAAADRVTTTITALSYLAAGSQILFLVNLVSSLLPEPEKS